MFEGVTFWRWNGLPQQTHTPIENPPLGSPLNIQVTTDHGSVGFLDRRQSQDVLLQRLNVHLNCSSLTIVVCLPAKLLEK